MGVLGSRVPVGLRVGTLAAGLLESLPSSDVWVVDELTSRKLNRETPAELQQVLAAETLQLSVIDVLTGSVSSIVHRNLADLVTRMPNGRERQVGTNVVDVSTEGKSVGVQQEAQVC